MLTTWIMLKAKKWRPKIYNGIYDQALKPPDCSSQQETHIRPLIQQKRALIGSVIKQRQTSKHGKGYRRSKNSLDTILPKRKSDFPLTLKSAMCIGIS